MEITTMQGSFFANHPVQPRQADRFPVQQMDGWKKKKENHWVQQIPVQQKKKKNPDQPRQVILTDPGPTDSNLIQQIPVLPRGSVPHAIKIRHGGPCAQGVRVLPDAHQETLIILECVAVGPMWAYTI